MRSNIIVGYDHRHPSINLISILCSSNLQYWNEQLKSILNVQRTVGALQSKHKKKTQINLHTYLQQITPNSTILTSKNVLVINELASSSFSN